MRLSLAAGEGQSPGRVYRRSPLPTILQRMQQCLRIFEIRCIKPFGEPPVNGCQEIMGFLVFALLVPQASQTCCGVEFPGSRLLRTGYTDGVLEAGFGFSLIVRRLL